MSETWSVVSADGEVPWIAKGSNFITPYEAVNLLNAQADEIEKLRGCLQNQMTVASELKQYLYNTRHQLDALLEAAKRVVHRRPTGYGLHGTAVLTCDLEDLQAAIIGTGDAIKGDDNQ